MVTKTKRTYKVVQSDWKGDEYFRIEEFEGEVAKKYPLHNFGIRKAKVLLDHLEELKKFVKDNDPDLKCDPA